MVSLKILLMILLGCRRGLLVVQESLEGLLMLELHLCKKLVLERLVFVSPRILGGFISYGHGNWFFGLIVAVPTTERDKSLPFLGFRCKILVVPRTNTFVIIFALVRNENSVSGGLLGGSIRYRGDEILRITLRYLLVVMMEPAYDELKIR